MAFDDDDCGDYDVDGDDGCSSSDGGAAARVRISNPMSDDKYHMMQSVASNTIKITCAFHIEGKQPCRRR